METKTLSKLSEIPQELRGKTLTKLSRTFFKNPEKENNRNCFGRQSDTLSKLSGTRTRVSEKNFDKVEQDFLLKILKVKHPKLF